MKSPASAPLLEPLLQAILHSRLPRARQLLQRHPLLATAQIAHPRLYQSTITHWLYVHDTPLHLAAAGHRAAIARLLLAAGADPNAADNHRRSRPLHYAADGFLVSLRPAQQLATLRVLLKAGADLHAADKNGATALHRAVRTRSAAAVAFLLQAGADPTARNLPGATPFHLAVQNTGHGGTGRPAARAAQRRIIATFLAGQLSPTGLKDARGKSVLDWATTPWIRQQLTQGGRPR